MEDTKIPVTVHIIHRFVVQSNIMAQEVTLRRTESHEAQARRCVIRDCGIFRVYFNNRMAQLDTIAEGVIPQEDDISPGLDEAYLAYLRSEDPDAREIKQELELQTAIEFVEAGFCRETSAQSPAEQYQSGHAGECDWLDEQVVFLKAK